jgi:hypothetical protein
LPADLTAPEDPEGIEAAKAWLSSRMPRLRPYSETIDQPALTAQFSILQATQSESFAKVQRDIMRLLAAITVP